MRIPETIEERFNWLKEHGYNYIFKDDTHILFYREKGPSFWNASFDVLVNYVFTYLYGNNEDYYLYNDLVSGKITLNEYKAKLDELEEKLNSKRADEEFHRDLWGT